jgi:transposase
MTCNFRRGDPDQPFLLPPDLRDWLPADHLAWFIRDVVDELDLEPFLRAYRADGHGHPAYDPKTLLGVLLMPTPSGCAPPGRSNGAATRTSRSGSLPATSSPTT